MLHHIFMQSMANMKLLWTLTQGLLTVDSQEEH